MNFGAHIMQSQRQQIALQSAAAWTLTLSIAGLLVCFGLIAVEVTKGEPIAFDRWIMRSFHPPLAPWLPTEPTWLPEVARDITALGSTVVLGIVLSVVTGY